MDIESLIPRHLKSKERDDFIKEVLLKDEGLNYIGMYFTDIKFNFKTDLPISNFNPPLFIECEGVELISYDKENWSVVNDEINAFLPKKYLLKTFKLK